MREEESDADFEIFFADLAPGAQKQLLKFLGISEPKEMNLDVLPLTNVPGSNET